MRGKCLCETVQFEITGIVPGLYQCHCSLCRKQGGSTSNTATVVPAGNFLWRSGEDTISRYALPTGFRSWFCATCGSTLPNPLRDTPYYWVPSGLFEGSENLQITVHLYVESRARWDREHLSGTLYDTMPGMQAFLEDLHG